MNRKILAFLAVIWGTINCLAQSDSVPLTDPKQLNLEEILVVSKKSELQSDAYRLVTQISHQQIESLPIQTVADILQYLPSLDVRTRGVGGAQADVSMRGGTFDQVLVLLNGVNLNDAQTGHYAMNLPISTALIERIEVLQGTSSHLFGAFSGAINIITRQTEQNEYDFRVTAGMNRLVNPEFAMLLTKNEWHFATSAEYSRANGYYAPQPSEKEDIALQNSDFQIANLFFQANYKDLNLQIGSQWKDVGAGMYYGFGSQDQFDATRTAFGSMSYKHRWNRWSIAVQATYRANYDRYEWHRNQRLYGNFHFTQNTSAALTSKYASKIGTTTLGFEFRNENIHSTNIGDTINKNGQIPNVEGFKLKDVRVLDLVKGKNRYHLNYFAQQTFLFHQLSASVGISGTYNNDFSNHFAGEANIGYEFAQASSVYINANRSLRMPTFTDLYYDAGNQLGNRDLQPEKALTMSVGGKLNRSFAPNQSLHIYGDTYFRWGKDIIDWVFTPEDSKRPYHAQNQQKVNATGVELTTQYRWKYSHERWNNISNALSLSYAYTYLDLDLSETGSRYLDYLSHKITLQLEHTIYKNVSFSSAFRFQKREGQYNNAYGIVENYTPCYLLDASLFWKTERFRISADGTNLTNRHYYDYGGLLQPGCWAKISLQYYLKK